MMSKQRTEIVKSVATQCVPSRYSNYQLYIKDLYTQIKSELDEKYSYNLFSEDLGLGFGNVAWLLVHGKRKLTMASYQKISKSLNLEGLEKRYLKALIKYNNAKSVELRQESLDQLIGLRNQLASDDEERKVLEFYSHWGHAIIFEMVGLNEFQSDPEWILQHLHAPLSKKNIESSLKLLVELNLIRFDEKLNRHVKVIEDFTSPTEVPGIGVIQFHLKMIQLGMEALETVPPDERDFSAVTLAISELGRQTIKDEIAKFRNYLMFIASQHSDREHLVEINFQMFNLTKKIGG